MLKKWLRISLWGSLGICTSILLVAAMQKKETNRCSGVQVTIDASGNDIFINKTDVLAIMKANGATEGTEISGMDVRKIEEQLEINPWIRDVELFFDNRTVLHVNIRESEPVARIFTTTGKSFYIDSSCRRLPLSEKCSARVPMFTSFPSDKKTLSKIDSMTLTQMKAIAMYIRTDSFLSAQVAQVDFTGKGGFEIIPVIGDQVIKIGDATELDEKFGKLELFYKQVWATSGFEKYGAIDLRYHDQVVATRRGSSSISADTATAMEEFRNTREEMKEVMNDTAFANEIVKPLPVVDSAALKKSATSLKKPGDKRGKVYPKPGKERKPKAVMKRH